MTWSAPSERMKSNLLRLSTAVTSAPAISSASCIANEPHCPRAIDQNLLSRLDLAFEANSIKGDHATLRDGGGLLEGRLAGFRIIVLPWVQTYSANRRDNPAVRQTLHHRV